jgi:hypothetical protein
MLKSALNINNNTTIILTSTVNVNSNKAYVFQTNINDRIETYLKSILQWLNKTNFNIILVENSGYNFNELNKEKQIYKDRFEVITFIENELEEAQYLKNNASKGDSEIFSINYAFNQSKIIKNSNFIIKITARFYIDELENYLNQFDLDKYDCLTQNNRGRCELVGSHYNFFSFIFNKNLIYEDKYYTGHIEYIWMTRASKCNNILVCKEFKIDKTQRGGLNECFSNI